MSEKTSRPERYATREVNGMDVIDLCKHWNLNFNEGNILKYLLRDKGEDVSDMGKIIDYATREKEYLVKTGLKQVAWNVYNVKDSTDSSHTFTLQPIKK